MNLKKIMKKLEAKHVYYLVMTVLFSYLVFKCCYECIFKNGIYGCKNELLLLIVLALVIYIVSFFRLDIFNKKKTKEKKKMNIRKMFFFKSIFLSLIITTFIYLLIAYNIIYIDFYSLMPKQEVFGIIGLAIILFVVFFILIYLISLFLFNKKTKEL